MWWLGRRDYHLPEATGPHVPGCMDVILDYAKEGVSFRLYYPTTHNRQDPRNTSRWIYWMNEPGYFAGIAKVLMSFTFVVRLAFWWAPGLIPVIYGGNCKVEQKLKCIVLSHGLGGLRSLYSNMCCELASRGFLVAALEHRDGSACYTYYYKSEEDAKNNYKTEVEYEPFRLGKDHHKQRTRQVNYRASECGKVVDFLINLNKGLVPLNVVDLVPTSRNIEFSLHDLVGNLDVESITIGGHSFGGATALLTLSQRPEIKQAILLDAWMYPIKDAGLEQKITQPLLFINTQTFHIVSNVQALAKFLNHKQTTTMYTILHTTHESQTDTVLLVGYWLNWFMKKLDPLVALKINNSLILEFLDKQIGSPTDVRDCSTYLDEQAVNIQAGLTKPWA